jgi:serine/threonine-protein kinase
VTVGDAGGETKELTTIDTASGELGHRFPSYLPGNRQILFTIVRSVTANAGDQDVAVYDLDTGEKRILIKGGMSPRYVETGHLVYVSTGGLRAVRFDVDGMEVIGNPVPVLESVFISATGDANALVSRDGTLVYVPGIGSATSAPSGLRWVSREGTEEAVKSATRMFASPKLSPDGRQVGVEIQDGTDDIWMFDLARGALTRQTFDPAEDETAVWSPDGRWLAYSSTRGTERLVLRRRADGSGSEETLLTTSRHVHVHQWTLDGRTLLLEINDTAAPSDVAALDVDGDRTLKPLLISPFSEYSAQLSPDGRWLAYVSNESGSAQVFVRAYPSLEGKWQVSIDGGAQPRWSPRGDELFYRGGGALMGVRVRSGPTFVADSPVKLFEERYHVKGAGHIGYDIAQDGRFLFVKDLMNEARDSDTPPLVVVLNWFEELRRVLPND